MPVHDALTPRLLFTDLDGSLLDPHCPDGSPARPWLARLKQHGVPVIPVTCRTRSELAPLRLALGLADTPFIAENGAVVGLPPAWCHARLDRRPGPDGLVVKTLGVDIGFIRKRLSVWRQRLGADFTLMSEIALEELSVVAGLEEGEARLARMREGSEPLLWHGDDAQLEALREGLAGDGLSLLRGERFWHVTGQADKGRAVDWLLSRFEALRGRRPHTLALGDGPNDVGMLEAVDQAVVIRNRHGLTVEPAQPALYRTVATGAAGWVEGVAHWWGRADSRLIPRAAADSRRHAAVSAKMPVMASAEMPV
ncbi:HAD-IIB family hydrolase [Halomonas campisalis]|uniref:HAD-IIB family hydrolase n=1 Tax=Billgrantia campisalis TaxID=74661 RepID=A0ABS9PC83_9GAMM|nr:HAD-IIB family hydrolase [Halomonas campisalis]MCG6659389.1 HAD-IIB family hydrolase [Halomonas campisalis]MDR5863991.1 HAD-IIB family hydrolase [Halomonas campisalis]